MGYPESIQNALDAYDQRIGIFREVFNHHPAISAIRNLPLVDQADILKIYDCFIKYPAQTGKASHDVLMLSVK